MAGVPSTFVVSLTPFTADGELDDVGLRAHLRRLGAAGIGVYVAGSGSGEGYTLDRVERRRVFDVAAEELGGRVPVRAMGVEPRTAAEAIEAAADAAAAGLDAIQLYPLDLGHGYVPRPAELEAYVVEVLESVDLPVVVSTHQSVGYRYPVELLAAAVERYDHVVGINLTSPDIAYLAEVLEAVAGGVDLHVGGPMHALTALALGARGYLSSEGNVAPRLCVRLIDEWRAGDAAATAATYTRLMRLFRATQRAGGIVGTKAALRVLGAPGGWPRPPRRTPDDGAVEALVGVIRELGLDVDELAE
jgi:4-hydroxy-tetrahydrodipicolinate synthase